MGKIEVYNPRVLKKMSRNQLIALLIDQSDETHGLELALKFERKKNEAVSLLKKTPSINKFALSFLEGLPIKTTSCARCVILETDFFGAELSIGFGLKQAQYAYLDKQVNEQLGGKGILSIPDTSKLHNIIFSPGLNFPRTIIAYPILLNHKKIGFVWISDGETNAYAPDEQEALGKGIGEFELALSLLSTFLKQSQAISTYEKIIHNIEEPIIVFDKGSKIPFANQAAITQFSLELKSDGKYVSKKNLLLSIDLDDAQVSLIDNETEFIGSLLKIHNFDNKDYKFCRFVNITRERSEDKYLSNIIKAICQYLKTEMVEIAGFIKIAANLGNISASQSEYLEKTNFNLQRIQNMVGDLLSIDRVKKDNFVSLGIVDINLSIDKVIELFQPIIKQKQLTFSKKYEDEPIILTTDSALLHHIFLNLFESAIHDSIIGSTVEIYQNISDNKYCFWIKDSGKGISKPDIEAFMDDSKAKNPYENLRIAKAFTMLLMGELSIESKIGKGKKVRISLPNI